MPTFRQIEALVSGLAMSPGDIKTAYESNANTNAFTDAEKLLLALITPTKGGTGLDSYTTGDLIYASATNVLSKLAVGTNGYVLTLAGGVPTWAAGGSALTFSTGLSGTTTITNNLSTGISGGQTVIGGTGVTDILSLKGTTGNGTLTSSAIKFLVGNNGGTIALDALNNGNISIPAYLAVGKTSVIDANTVLSLKGIGTTSKYLIQGVDSADVQNFTVNDAGDGYFKGLLGLGTAPSSGVALRITYSATSGRGIELISNGGGNTSAAYFEATNGTQCVIMQAPARILSIFPTQAPSGAIIDSTYVSSTVNYGTNAGVGTFYQLKNASGNYIDMFRHAVIFSNATNGAERSAHVWQTVTAGGALTEAMRLDGKNLGLGGTSFQDGSLVVFIANATTVPTTNPVGGGIIYCEAGALKYRGSSGTVTTLGVA